MAASDYNKLKEISPTSTNDSGATVDKAQPVLLEMGRRDGSISSPESTNTTTSTSFDVVVKEGYQAIPNYFVGIENANDSNSLDYNLEVRDSSDNILVSQTGTIAAGDDLGVSEGTFSKEDYSRIPSNETITIVFESTNGVSFYYNSSIPGEDELFFSVASGQSVPTRSGGSGFGIGIDSVNDDTVTGTGSVGLDWTNISSESDIAVYDQNGNLLPYEIESFDATAETAVLWCWNSWVRDDTVQAQIVYGDGSATASSTVKQVDGFEDGDFTSNPTWTEAESNGTATVQSNTVKEGSNALEISTDGSGFEYLSHDRGASDGVSDGDTYQTWANIESGERCRFGLANESGRPVLVQDAIVITPETGGSSQDRINIIAYDGSGDLIESSNIVSDFTDSDTWVLIELEVNPSSNQATGMVYDSNYNELGSATISTSGASNLQYVSFGSDDISSGSSFFDDISYSTTDTTYEFIISEEDVTSTWNNTGQNAVMVQHLQDNPLTATDSTSNNNDGTVNGAVSTAGQFDGAGSFDGTDDYISTPSGLFADKSTYTVLTYAKTNTSETTPYAIGESDGSNFKILYIGDSNGVVNYNSSNISGTDFAGSTNITDDTYHQIVLTQNSSNERFIYVDASQDGSSTASDGTITFTEGNGFVGGDSNFGQYYPGDLDAVRIYSENKSNSWLQADYDASPKAGQVFFSQSAAQTTTTKITANETINSQDVYARNLNVFRSYSENVSANDLLKLVPVLKFSESVSSSDTISKTISLQNNEDVSISATYNDNYGTLSGTVTLDSSPVQGAKVYAVRDSDLQQVGSDTTDSNGNYNINSIEENQVILVAVDYDDAGTLYGEEKSIDF